MCELLKRSGLTSLAYMKYCGKSPSGIFYPGFMSDMGGTKAVMFEKLFQSRGLGFTKFDYSGVGQSVMEKFRLSFETWLKDSLQVLDDLTEGPQILIGSSMGAWMAALVALQRPSRIAAMLLIAPALDFTLHFQETFPDHVRNQMATGETVFHQFSSGQFPVSQQFVDESLPHFLLSKPSIPIDCPVRIVHGMLDSDVPWKSSLRIVEKLQSNDVDVIFRKSGQHRLSEESDLKLLRNTMHNLIDQVV